MTSLYEVLKAQKMGAAIAPDYFTALWAGATGGGGSWETIEYTGAVPVEIIAAGEPLIDYLISGNMQQTGTPTPTTPIQPQETGERTGNLFDIAKQTVNNKIVTLLDFGEDKNFPLISLVFEFSNAIAKEKNAAFIDLLEDNGTHHYITLKALRLSRTGGTDSFPLNEIVNDTYYASFTNFSFRYIKMYLYTSSYCSFSQGDIKTAIYDTNKTAFEPYGYKLDISSGGENLYNKDATDTNNGFVDSGYLYNNGGVSTSSQYFVSEYIPTQPNTDYTLVYADNAVNAPSVCFYDSSKSFISGEKYDGRNPVTFTTPNETAFIRFSGVDNKKSITMLNLGSTAKPYSPYNRTTTPIYLGEVETTRRVKKLVLTGEENWRSQYGGYVLSVTKQSGLDTVLSTHYIATVSSSDKSVYGNSTNVFIIFDSDYSTLADFKSYLATQYANGTPVTIWYVLAEPTTGIVNEPIRKIGDYADTISAEQAGVSIPTVEGANVVDVETTLKPSQIYIKYKGRESE